MERLFYALQLLTLGDKKFIRQLAKYKHMDYVRKCVNTRFELAPTIMQDKWLDEQFQTCTQIISLPEYYRTLISNRHYWNQPAHLCVNPMTQCMRQRLRQQEKCVLNKRNSVGLHGSASPRVSHVDRCVLDWSRDCCIMTQDISCRATMATRSCTDKVNCLRATIISIFKQ